MLPTRPSPSSTTFRTAHATGLARDVKGELNAWWNRKRPVASAHTPHDPCTDSGSSSSAFNSPISPSQPMWRRRSHSSAATTVSDASASDYKLGGPTSPQALAAPPAGREHLHYRDFELQNPASYPPVDTVSTPRRPRRHSSALVPAKSADDDPSGELDEQAALDRALEASLLDANKDKSDEDAELQRALAESTQLAMSTSRTDQEKSDLARAILESKSLALREAQHRTSLQQASRPAPSSPLPTDSSAPPTLDESEWIIRARNEKGEIWQEAGAHGWLPPGARRAQDDDDDEALEKAIRISLEEEAARKAYEAQFEAELQQPPPLPPRRRAAPTRDSTFDTVESYRTAASRPFSSSSHSLSNASSSSEAATRGPPSRPIPAPPLNPFPSPLTSQSSHTSRTSTTSSASTPHSPSFVAPSTPKIFGVDATRAQSPEERPYLGSFSARPSQLRASGDAMDDTSSGPGSSRLGSSTDGTDSSYDDATSTMEQLTPPATPAFQVRNPDVSNLSIASPSPISTSPYTPYISEYAGRSLSLLSEHTEPGSRDVSGSSKISNTSHLPTMARTQSPTGLEREEEDEFESSTGERSGDTGPSFASGPERLNVGPSEALMARLEAERLRKGSSKAFANRGIADLGAQTPPLSLDPSAGPLATSDEILRTQPIPIPSPSHNLSSHSKSHIIDDERTPLHSKPTSFPLTPPDDAQPPPVTVFGDGVRFGFPEPCARDHACLMDGLHSTAPFPERIELTTFGLEAQHHRTFAVESRTWVSLLRFLMWYGETTLQASAEDVEEEDSRHCDALLALEFRPNDEGVGIIRLTITLLPPNHTHSPPELTLLAPPSSPSSGKGKARAPTTDTSSTRFLLPDHLVLPSRLSSLAIQLYTLRHLSGIALSTQPSKDAAQSYHALRALGHSISKLAAEHSVSREVQREQTKFDEERLLGKLRERLRRMKPGGGAQGAKLLKTPPVQQAQRTQELPRREGVLSNSDFESVEREEGEDDRRERVEHERVMRELRFMPSL